MKKLIFSIALAGLLLTGCQTSETPADEASLYPSCKPYTRWWWFAGQLDDRDIRDQLEWLAEHGFGGVEIAWIYPMGLDSLAPHPDFLSDEWAAHVAFAKRTADSLGLGCDFTYGTLWPFNDVDLPSGDQTRNYFDTIEPARRSFTWDHPRQGRILNHLDGKAFGRYASKMNRGLSEAYKGSKSGLFVDSWEVETEYLWTPGFDSTFRLEHGYDITPYMQQRTLIDPSTHVVPDPDVFYDYMHTLSGYVMREFYQPFAQNARNVGAFARAQCGGAPTDLLTAFTLVDVPETEAILYEPPFSKIAASAATLTGRGIVTAEAFTCAYGWTGLLNQNGRGHSPHQGKEQFGDLKLICDALFANGTNQIIWHGFPYNKVGDTSNFFYTTCQLSTSSLNNLSGQNLTDFNRYMTTVSSYMRKGHNYSSVAVYMPVEDAWMGGAYPDSLRKVKAFFWGQYEMRYANTPDALKGMQPLWVNEHFLQSAHYQRGTLHCGEASFQSLYVDVEYMELSALEQILWLAEEGLPVCLMRTPKEPGKSKHPKEYKQMLERLKRMGNVVGNIDSITTTPLISGENLPDFWCREDNGTFYIFFANPMTQTISYPLEYCYAYRDKGTVRNIVVTHHGKTERYRLMFKPTESILLKIDRDGIHQIPLDYTPPRL